ncbi:MAG TPA: anthranilate phosphoribosyltransferase [Alphaproteobacteria bacterium]|nr:anthranilate phosphoribosyltransferase [Alphaproteobacteria bacterium]
MTSLDQYLNNISEGAVLTEQEMESVMRQIMKGDAQDEQIAALLTRLAERGEAVSEITGAARVMREMAAGINAPSDAMDCCGTGGDGSGTYNISTAVALVSAACGVPVAKHGNRAASSKSGAADVLEALGANLNLSKEQLEIALKQFNFCFLMAPHHHQAMKHVMPVRKSLGFRTIFNLLGPLANPAGTKFQLIGVFDKKWVRPMAEVLNNLGTKGAWVVHGQDGLDEITTTTATDIAILKNGEIEEKTITPDDYGLEVAMPDDLKGGDAKENAAALRALLEGKKSPYRDIVLANVSAVLNIHGKVDSLRDGVAIAAANIDNGKAMKALENYIEFSKEK